MSNQTVFPQQPTQHLSLPPAPQSMTAMSTQLPLKATQLLEEAPVTDVSQSHPTFGSSLPEALSQVGVVNYDMPLPPPDTRVGATVEDADKEAEGDAEDLELEEGEPPKEQVLSLESRTVSGSDGGKKKETVLSRQDTWLYMQGLQSSDWSNRTEAARALKSLAFNAEPEYKEGLIKAGVCRLLMRMLASGSTNSAIEQATSCMYSLAREHLVSKQELVKVGALRQLSEFLGHASKQCRLNATATLYAVSCSGRSTCRELAQFNPLPALKQSVTPGLGRNAQDDQLQLFAALLIVNLLHVRGVAGSKQERASLECCLTRAYEDATEEQVRETINIGLRRISMLNSRRERMKVGAMKRVSRALNRISLSAKGPAGGSAAAADLPPTTSVFVSAPLDQGRPNSGRSVSKVRQTQCERARVRVLRRLKSSHTLACSVASSFYHMPAS